MVELTLTIQGDKEILAKLRNLSDSLNDMTRPLRSAGNLMTKFYSSVPFASRGSIYGTPWPSLSPAYAKYKAKKFPGRPILVATETMMHSFEFDSSSDMLRIYNTTDYFRKHQLGEGVPQRMMMLLDQQREKIVTDAVAEEIERKLGSTNGL